MIAKIVIFSSIIEPRLPNIAFGGTHGTMVKENLSHKRPGLPALHAGRPDSDPVEATPLDGSVSADFLEAFAPEKLAPAKHVVFIVETVLQRIVVGLAHGGAGHAQPGVLRKFLHEKIHVIRLEGNIRVQIAQHIEFKELDTLEAGVKGMHLAGKTAF